MYRVLLAALAALPLLASPSPAAMADSEDLFDRVDHHFVDNEGVKIHYVTLGEGPVVLFVHGFPDFWYSWRQQMEGLASDFRTVAMDTRAYNKSDKPKGVENYGMPSLLSDVAAVIADLDVSRITLVGHDWGGGIAWSFAMVHPELVENLVILNLTHPKGYGAVRRNATEEQKRNTQYIEEFQKPGAHERFTPELTASFVAGTDPKVRERYVAAFARTDFEGALNYYRAAFPSIENNFEQEMPNLAMPVLQFHGLQDRAVDKQGLRDTWNWIDGDYTLVTVPSSGHWVQRDAADLVTTTMRWWLLMRR